jgi:hypothetical protein
LYSDDLFFNLEGAILGVLIQGKTQQDPDRIFIELGRSNLKEPIMAASAESVAALSSTQELVQSPSLLTPVADTYVLVTSPTKNYGSRSAQITDGSPLQNAYIKFNIEGVALSAAPGFDACLIGGTTFVNSKNGETLQVKFNTAIQSSPDAIGLISWKELSENSHIEPSENHDDRYLKVLAKIWKASAPVVGNFDSSEPGTTAITDFDSSEPASTTDNLGTDRLFALGVVGLFMIIRRVIH